MGRINRTTAEPPVASGRGSTAYPPVNGSRGYGPGDPYRDSFKQAYRGSSSLPGPGMVPPRRRRPWYAKKRIMFPLAFILGVGLMLGAMWYFTPIVDPSTGARSFRGEHFLNLVPQVVRPGHVNLKTAFGGQQQVRVLLVGLDHVPVWGTNLATHRSDSMLVASTDFETKQVRLLSIPRDGWVNHYDQGEEQGYDKLGHTYALGQEEHPDDPEGGVKRTKETIERLIELPIDYYVVIDFKGFEKVIDALGGLEVDVEKRMYYNDNGANLHIDLQPGLQHLDGYQAMGYARFRKDALGDIGRMARQQKILKLILEKMQRPENLPRLPLLFGIFQEHVQTNMQPDQLMALARNLKDFDSGHMQTMTIENYGSHDGANYDPMPRAGRNMGAQYIPDSGKLVAREFLLDLAPPQPEGVDLNGDGVIDESEAAQPADDADKAWTSAEGDS
jgi:LCP family protein required for cell wall assembly